MHENDDEVKILFAFNCARSVEKVIICTVKLTSACLHTLDKYMLSTSINEYILYFSLPPVAEEPDLSRLVVSNITSDRFSLSWRTGERSFDNFIVEVRESALPSQAMGRALPGDVRSTVMAGLKASTRYNIKLYASAGGQNTQPLFDVATTGISLHAFFDTACSKLFVIYQHNITEKPSSFSVQRMSHSWGP